MANPAQQAGNRHHPVVCRVVQQALIQVLDPVFDADFSESNVGFGYGCRAQDACVSPVKTGINQWVRLCFWKNKKRARTRRRKLIALGVDPQRVKLVSRSRKGLWRLSRNSLVCQALNDQCLKDQRVPFAGHCLFGTAVIRTRMSGTVRAGGVKAPRYSIRTI